MWLLFYVYSSYVVNEHKNRALISCCLVVVVVVVAAVLSQELNPIDSTHYSITIYSILFNSFKIFYNHFFLLLSLVPLAIRTYHYYY